MNFYPYSSPIILSDAIFTLYGGHTGSSVPAQRQAAYLIAEMAASDDISSFLLPTIVTGTSVYNPFRPFIFEHAFVTKIIRTRFIVKMKLYFKLCGELLMMMSLY